MKFVGHALGFLLNILRLKSVRCLVGMVCFLGAYAASGRGLWLGLALGVCMMALGVEVMRRRRIADRIGGLPELDATLEAQELAKRKFLPGHVEIPLKPEVLATCALLGPSWEETRNRLIADMRLPDLSAAEAEARSTLSAAEQALMFHLETSIKRRLAGYEFRHFLNQFRRDKSEKAKRAREAEEAAHPILLADGLRPIQGPVEVRFLLEERVALPGMDVFLEPGNHVAEIRLTHTPPVEGADWFESELRCDFMMKRADGRGIRAASKLYLPGLADLEQPEFSEQSIAWREAPASWREAMENRCLACGLQVCDDGRSRFVLVLGGREHVIMTKYLSYSIDLALEKGGKWLIVRVHGLLAEKWKGNPFSDSDEEAEFLDYEGVEPFAARIPVERLVPVCSPDLHVDAAADHVNDEMPVQYRVMA